MNIYHIKWTIKWIRSGRSGLCAVVIADNETDALKELELDLERYRAMKNIRIWLIGTTTPGLNVTRIVCRECL